MFSRNLGVPVRHVLFCIFLFNAFTSLRCETHFEGAPVDSGVGVEIHRPVLDGAPSTVKQVVQLYSVLPDGRKGSCSGTVVSDTDILTAAHCIHDGAQMQVELPGKGRVALSCFSSSSYSRPSPADVKKTEQAQLSAMQACEQAKANPGDSQAEERIRQADQAFQDLRKQTQLATPDQVAKDLAICKVTSGSLGVEPARVAAVDRGSSRYVLVGYGFSAQSTSGQTGSGTQRIGRMTFAPDPRPGIIRSDYQAGDPQRQSGSFGDSGGPLLAAGGSGVQIGGVYTGFTSAGRQELDRSSCRYVYRGASQGVNLFADLTSPDSRRFFAEAQARGFRVNGVTGDSSTRVAENRQSVNPTQSAPRPQSTGSGAYVAVSGRTGNYPEIQIGVPHAPPRQGQVFQIGGRLWRYRGNGEWLPAEAISE